MGLMSPSGGTDSRPFIAALIRVTDLSSSLLRNFSDFFEYLMTTVHTPWSNSDSYCYSIRFPPDMQSKNGAAR